MRFQDRKDAGEQLAHKLDEYRGLDVVVFALPRGGVVVGYEIAQYLGAPLDLIIVRKVGHPQNPDYAICAVADDGHVLCNEREINSIDRHWLEHRLNNEKTEAMRWRQLYLNNRQHPAVEDKIVVLVDDGISTGLTFLLAVEELKHYQPKVIIAAVPIASEEVSDAIRSEADELVVLNIPFDYEGQIGAYYDEFYSVTDDEVVRLMQRAPQK
ncbi:MAG: putative phosphoribosyl transferase [bacterium ADurb.Bin400]|nr:MAG: putative phosphoribosyl transferase [bacterium ADurb.Bin400]